MVKIALGLAALLALPASSAWAQGAIVPQDLPAGNLTPNGGTGIRSGNITSTGETVANPGASQSEGTTPMDRGVERENNKIDSSICKGC